MPPLLLNFGMPENILLMQKCSFKHTQSINRKNWLEGIRDNAHLDQVSQSVLS